MKSKTLLSIGCSAVEAGVSIAVMQRALDEVGARTVIELNRVAYYAASDVDRAIEHLQNRRSVASQRGGNTLRRFGETREMTNDEKKRAIEAFVAAIKRETDAGKTRADAVSAVARKSPTVHRRFLAATHRGYRPDDE
jgi:2,4-dienoyl-CoA reductase-like NADH-dependent reductase (Old Yellow Enzyme family)